MKLSYILKYRVLLPVLFCFLTASPIIAADYEKYITESYVKNEFTFQDGERFKYSKCEQNAQNSCKYIWGGESKKDAARAEYGLPPEGNQLSVVYVQAKREKDFLRVLSTYSDAVDIDDLAVKAVWSEKRKQLSMITKSNLIIHVRIKVKGMSNTKNKTQSVAQHILSQL